MKPTKALAFAAFALSLGLAAFSVHAGPLAGALGAAKEAALGGLHLRHDVADKDIPDNNRIALRGRASV